MGKNKSECDREMVKSLDEIPYGEMPKWGQTARFIINATQKLGLGVTKNGRRLRNAQVTATVCDVIDEDEFVHLFAVYSPLSSFRTFHK